MDEHEAVDLEAARAALNIEMVRDHIFGQYQAEEITEGAAADLLGLYRLEFRRQYQAHDRRAYFIRRMIEATGLPAEQIGAIYDEGEKKRAARADDWIPVNERVRELEGAVQSACTFMSAWFGDAIDGEGAGVLDQLAAVLGLEGQESSND